MKPLPALLAVRFKDNKRIDFLPLDFVTSVYVKENVSSAPLHHSYSSIYVEWTKEGKEARLSYGQFSEPACFDLICDHFGLESDLDRKERENFKVRRDQANKDFFDEARRENPQTDYLAKAVDEASPKEKRKLFGMLQNWFSSSMG